MGAMKQLWYLKDVQSRFKTAINVRDNEVIAKVFEICVDIAQKAKNNHGYDNYKGELESSVGVVVLKDRMEVAQWKLLAGEGSNPLFGFDDFRNFVYDYLVGKATLPNGAVIPRKGVVGIVFSAAPYAGEVEDRGRAVLDRFTPGFGFVYQIIKSVGYS